MGEGLGLSLGLRAWGLGFKNLGVRVWGLGFCHMALVQGLDLNVGLGFKNWAYCYTSKAWSQAIWN